MMLMGSSHVDIWHGSVCV